MRITFLNPQGNFDPQDSYLTEHPDFGGQLVYVKELSLALARMGVEIDIATRLIDDPDWSGFSESVDHYQDCQDRLRILRIPFGGPRFLEKEKLWPHIPEFIENLVHFYDGSLPDYLTGHYADGGYSCVLAQQRTGLGFTFTGHSLGAQKLDKLGMNGENINGFEARFHFAQRIDAERFSMQRADTVITSTDQERNEQYGHALYLGAIDPADDGRFAVIPPGVNIDIFNDSTRIEDEVLHRELERRTGSHDQPYVVMSSRLDEKKNIAGVFDAYVQSGSLRRKARLALFVRGIKDPFNELDNLPATDRPVMESLLAKIEAADIRDSVDFFDIRSQRELAGAYRYFARRGSVFVLSSFYEPFGLAPIEAAACGLAVVATCNGGPTDIFSDGSAVLIDPADAVNMGEGIEKALARSAHYASLGKKRVLSRYTWDQTARGYLAVIERNLTRSKRDAGPLETPDASALIRSYLAAVS
jgi:sucrose-phosphate synthase